MTRRCGPRLRAASAFAASAVRCATPKRCCSSMTMRPRRRNSTGPRGARASRRACRCGRRRAASRSCARALPLTRPVRSSARKRVLPKIRKIVAKCCSARISVGAMSAVWQPHSAARIAERTATIVLPLPTSPWRSRRIGRPDAEVLADLADHALLRGRERERRALPGGARGSRRRPTRTGRRHRGALARGGAGGRPGTRGTPRRRGGARCGDVRSVHGLGVGRRRPRCPGKCASRSDSAREGSSCSLSRERRGSRSGRWSAKLVEKVEDESPPHPRRESRAASGRSGRRGRRKEGRPACPSLVLLFTFEEFFDLRVLHDEAAPVARRLGRDPIDPEDLLRRQPALEVRLVEEDEAERSRAVVEDRLEDREARRRVRMRRDERIVPLTVVAGPSGTSAAIGAMRVRSS